MTNKYLVLKVKSRLVYFEKKKTSTLKQDQLILTNIL